jgi:hypothetical protein
MSDTPRTDYAVCGDLYGQSVVFAEFSRFLELELTAENERIAALEGECITLNDVIYDTAKALGCEPDNEAILQAIEILKMRANS